MLVRGWPVHYAAMLFAMTFPGLALHALADEPPHSVLGLEPGALRLCNDDVGVILWGPDSSPTLSIGKSDVWDRRLPAAEKPVLTLEQIMAMAREGDPGIVNGRAYYTGYNSYDFPCPKPVGQVILQLPFLEPDGNLSFEKTEEMTTLTATQGKKKLVLRFFVSSAKNLIVIRGQATALEPGDVAIRLWRHCDTIVPGGELNPTINGGTSPKDFEQLPGPSAGSDENSFWIVQDYPAEMTFPKGFTSVLAGRFRDLDVRFDSVNDKPGLGTPMVAAEEGRLDHGVYKRFTPINEAPGAAATAYPTSFDGEFELFFAVATTQDDPAPLSLAKQMLQEAVSQGAESLWGEHKARLDDYANRPHARAWSADENFSFDVPWGGVPYRVRPAGYYGDIPLCSVESTKYCFQDSGLWHGDFHFNEVDATSLCIQRQFDKLECYYVMLLTMLPMAQANAREVYGMPGSMYPLVHYPLKAETVIHGHVTWEQSIEITALLARPFWLRFQYTWDMDFLREKAYPMLREGARFYADYLTLEDDGLYHVFPTVSPEHRGITPDLEFNKDSQSAITLIRFHLRAAARSAALLELESEEAARWREISEHMPPYPTIESPEGPIFTDIAGAQPMEFNIAVPLTSVFWGDDIGLDSPPEQIELAKRTLATINVWKPHQGYLTTVRRRLGIYLASDGIGVESLLQSHTGVLRVFPAVPTDFEGGFENLGAQGAFVVGAERGREGPRSITIQSLAGNPCILANPWPGTEPRLACVETREEIQLTVDEALLRFDTRPGQTYTITLE